MVAQYADIWHTFSQGDELAYKSGVLDAHCLAIGCKGDEIEISVGVGGRGRDGRAPEAPEAPEEEGQALLEAGVSLFTIGVGGPTTT